MDNIKKVMIKLKYWLVVSALVLTLILNYSRLVNRASAQNLNNTENHPKEYYFGIRKGTPPLGSENDLSTGFSENEDNSWKGYCIEFKKALQNKIPNIKLIPAGVSLENRFTGFNDGSKFPLIGECGSDSITEEREEFLKKKGASFSNSFAFTGAKFLLKNENIKLLHNSIPFENNIIGVLGKDRENNQTNKTYSPDNPLSLKETTTENLIKSIYPYVKITYLKDRIDAADELHENRIQAYTTDEIILKTILRDLKNRYPNEKYSILPRLGRLSYEKYGIVVYKNDIGLETIINDFLITPEAEKISQENLLLEKNLLNLIEDFLYKHDIGFLVIFLSLIIICIIIPLFILIFVKFSPRNTIQRIFQILAKMYRVLQNRNNQVPIDIRPIVVLVNNYFYLFVYILRKDITGVTIMAEESNQEINNDFRGSQLAGGVVNADRVEAQQIGGNIINYAEKQSLEEVVSEIQEKLELFEREGLTPQNAQQRVAEDLARSANNDDTVRGKLVRWGKSLGNTAINTTIAEGAKEVFKIALRQLGIIL